jgi:hypothetical protein
MSFQIELSSTPAFTGGGGSKEKEWTRGFFQIPEEYRERIEEEVEQAAEAREPASEVERNVAAILREAEIERQLHAAYIESILAAYRERQRQEMLARQRQEAADEEMAQVIALVLLH